MSDLIYSCMEFVRRITRCPIELVTVRSLSGELQSNRICRVLQGICWENCEVSDLIDSCMEFVRRITRCLIE